MISGRSRASGRLEALSPSFSGPQIGIGYYEAVEAVGSDYFTTPVHSPVINSAQRLPQVVSLPAPGNATLLPKQRAALSALTVMGLFAAAVVAAWAGKEVVQNLRGTA